MGRDRANANANANANTGTNAAGGIPAGILPLAPMETPAAPVLSNLPQPAQPVLPPPPTAAMPQRPAPVLPPPVIPITVTPIALPQSQPTATAPTTDTSAVAAPTSATVDQGVITSPDSPIIASSVKAPGGTLASPTVDQPAAYDPTAALQFQMSNVDSGGGGTSGTDTGAPVLSFDQGGVITEPVVGRGVHSGRTYILVGNGKPEKVTPVGQRGA